MNFRAKTAIPDGVVVDVPQYPPVPVSDLFKKIQFRILRSSYKFSLRRYIIEPLNCKKGGAGNLSLFNKGQ